MDEFETLIQYWLVGSAEDIDTAQILFEKAKYRECLFFVHLSLEKAVKAHVVRRTGAHAPKIHNLVRLAELANLKLDDVQRTILFEYNQYCMAGRYPGAKLSPMDRALAKRELERAYEVLLWLQN